MAAATKPAWLRTAFHVFVATVGATAVIVLVRSVGVDALLPVLRRGLAWLPLLVALEGGRIVLEVQAHLRLFGKDRRAIPKAEFLRANLVGYTLANVLPLGRAAGEATKAAIVSAHVGFPRAAAAATSMQALSLVALGIVALPSLLAAVLTTSSAWLVWGLVGHVVATLGAGVGIGWLGQRPAIRRLLERFRASAPSAKAYQDALHDQLRGAMIPLAALTFGRLLQALAIGVALIAAGVELTLPSMWIAQGVHLVGTTIGDAVPAHLGTTDVAFVAGAEHIGADSAQAMAIALLAHLTQIFWVLVGGVAPFCGVSRRSKRAPTGMHVRGEAV